MSETIRLRGGTMIDADVLSRVLDMEVKGVRFQTRPDGKFTVQHLTNDEDRAWIRDNSEAVRTIVTYKTF